MQTAAYSTQLQIHITANSYSLNFLSAFVFEATELSAAALGTIGFL